MDPLTLLYLSRADIEGLGLGMREVLQAVQEGFRLKGLGLTEMPPKPGIHPVSDAFIHAMPAYVGGATPSAGVKWVSGFPENPARGLPYITGLLVLNDPQTGVPLAVMDCAWITAMRTGASVGVAARHLVLPKADTAAFLGCGVQARTSLLALHEVMPELRYVRCLDLLPAAAAAFSEEMAIALPGLQFVPVSTPAELARGAQVVVSAIPIVTNPRPPMQAGMLELGAVAVSLDYDSAWTTAAMAECERFVPDDTSQLLATKAHHVYFHGIPETIHYDLGELALGRAVARQHDQERFFVMAMGIAVDDMVTARLIFERAQATGAGTRLPL